MSYLSQSGDDLTEECVQASHGSINLILTKTSNILREFRAGNRGTLDDTSPLFLDWLYRASTTSLHFYQKTQSAELYQELILLKEMLQRLGLRWRAAGMWDPRVFFWHPCLYRLILNSVNPTTNTFFGLQTITYNFWIPERLFKFHSNKIYTTYSVGLPVSFLRCLMERTNHSRV
jgi:hypothetical protein